MELTDLKLLRALAKSHRLTHRDLADVAGYKSHGYIGKLMRGEATTLEPTPAARLAHHFGVDLGDLFTPRSTKIPSRTVTKKGKAA